jgi:methionyl-tRNA synthetase
MVRKGVPVKELADRNAARFEAMAVALNASHDRFIRTTEPEHYASCQEIWRRMKANGDIYLDQYEGWYSVRDEAYYAEKELTVAADNQKRSPQGTPVEWVKEQNYKFRLSNYAERLLKLYDDTPNFISPDSRKNEIVSFVKGGLQDISISRTTFSWGVPVPDDDAHVMYVWVDALTNYVTGVGFPNEKAANWKRWPADVHIIGKDIIRFHAVYWPAFLMSAGLALPKRVFGHGFVLNKGEKMSKSVGNVVDPFDLVKAYGVDQVRYFFLREVAFGQDGNYSHEQIVNRINAELANDLGNLAQRSLSMIAKTVDAKVPAQAEFTAADSAMLALVYALPEKLRAAMEDFALHTMLNDIWAITGEANRYFASQEPWKLAKTDTVRRDTVLYVTIELLRCVGIACLPFIPTAAAKLLDLLAVPQAQRLLEHAVSGHALTSGTSLPTPEGIFPRYIEPETVSDKT